MRVLEDSAGDDPWLGPALCSSACGLLGGSPRRAVSTAAALSLEQVLMPSRTWADIESAPARTPHRGNELQTFLDDLTRIDAGVGRATRQVHVELVREYELGRATLTGWIRGNRWTIDELEYLRVVRQAKAWRSFVAPVLCGAAIAKASLERTLWLRRFAMLVGVASFVARDIEDIEAGGLERSLPLLHTIRVAEPMLQQELIDALTPKEASFAAGSDRDATSLVQHANFVSGSIPYARDFVRELTDKARFALDRTCEGLPHSDEREYFEDLIRAAYERR